MIRIFGRDRKGVRIWVSLHRKSKWKPALKFVLFFGQYLKQFWICFWKIFYVRCVAHIHFQMFRFWTHCWLTKKVQKLVDTQLSEYEFGVSNSRITYRHTNSIDQKVDSNSGNILYSIWYLADHTNRIESAGTCSQSDHTKCHCTVLRGQTVEPRFVCRKAAQ